MYRYCSAKKADRQAHTTDESRFVKDWYRGSEQGANESGATSMHLCLSLALLELMTYT